MRARLQLSFEFAAPPPRPFVVVAPLTSPSPSPLTSPSLSSTRLLENAIRAANPGARVRIVDTRTRLLSCDEKDGVRTVVVHQLFLETNDDERAALARYVATGDKAAGAVVDAVIRRQQHLLDFMARPLAPDAHVGRTHDLKALHDQVSRDYFDGAVAAGITWAPSPRSARGARRHITFGSYDYRERRIAIHPALDEPDVPALVVARVVHHELLHARHGEGVDDRGRRVLHSPAFRREEALFRGAAEADRWLDDHLERLLAWRPRRGDQGR
jgi:hypothetical protein